MAKKQTTPRKGRARPADEAKGEFEVEEEGAEVAKPQPGVEQWLIFITFAGLAAAFLMIQVKLHAAFGKGWPF